SSRRRPAACRRPTSAPASEATVRTTVSPNEPASRMERRADAVTPRVGRPQAPAPPGSPPAPPPRPPPPRAGAHPPPPPALPRRRQLRLRPEVVLDQAGGHAGLGGDGADRRAGEAALGERAQRRPADPRACGQLRWPCLHRDTRVS